MGRIYFLFILFILLMGAHGLPRQQLRFKQNGRFKILQVADMHYANGRTTKCRDVLPEEYGNCNDLNTTAFIDRLIEHERPDLIVFTGDNIFGRDTSKPQLSMDAAFAPAIKAQIPWAAILGNHDQESTLSRLQVMNYITNMQYTLSQVYPSRSGARAGSGDMTEVDGFGNYHLSVRGVLGSPFENHSILNLYFLDSGDYSKLPNVDGYGWIQESQKKWFKDLSRQLRDDFQEHLMARNVTTPALVFFHIPLVETRKIRSWHTISGVKQENIGCAEVNSGFLETMWDLENPHMVFNGHDHVNDFCGDLIQGNVKMCYGGGVGYHAYGRAGWDRRARIINVLLRNSSDEVVVSHASVKAMNGSLPTWLEVEQIATWKRLDQGRLLPAIDFEILWSRLPVELSQNQIKGWRLSLIVFAVISLLLCFIFSSWWPFPFSFGPFGSSQNQSRYANRKSYTHTLSKLHSYCVQ